VLRRYAAEVDLDGVAARSARFTGAELRGVVREAALAALRENMAALEVGGRGCYKCVLFYYNFFLLPDAAWKQDVQVESSVTPLAWNRLVSQPLGAVLAVLVQVVFRLSLAWKRLVIINP
jgi:SpoVK/Ycf46/Vps4 family AAA+-type ATPase